MSDQERIDPERGDVIVVHWCDISEDATGDPASATLSKRTSYGLFWERRKDKDGTDVLVTTTTLDADLEGQNGYCIYPAAVVRGIMIIKRARRRKRTSSSGATQSEHPPKRQGD